MSLDFDDEPTYEVLLRVCARYAVDPSASLETERFFREMLLTFDGTPESTDITSWLEHNVAEHFSAIGERPRWLQSAKWPFANGQPMIFAGQIDWNVQESTFAAKLFHDDTSLYVFMGAKTRPVVIMQQS